MPWDPVQDLLGMQERLETLFGQAPAGWVPPVDLAELADAYCLTVELPGLRREDVHIEFIDDALTIRGQRPPETCPDRYQQFERGQGRFSRSFRFARAVARDGITADLVDGVLTVVVPKTDAASPRRIAVE